MTEHTKMMIFVKTIYMLSYAVIQCGYIIAWTLSAIELAGGPCTADEALHGIIQDIQTGLDEKLKDALKGEQN